MTIGQALAMMRSAEQFKDYQNRLNAQPTIDWRDVTQQPVGPEAPPAGYASMPMGQAVFAAPPPVPAEEYTQYEAPVGPPDQYAVESPIAGEPVPFDYGEVVQQSTPYEPSVSPADQFAAYMMRTGAMEPSAFDLGGRDFYEPESSYATRPPQQQAAFAAYPSIAEETKPSQPMLPPPPIPGAAAMSSQAMMRPQTVATDVATEEPIQAGADIAMLEQPSTKAQEQPSAAKQPQQPVFQAGQPFKATLKFGGKDVEVDVPNYTPPKPGSTATPKTISIDITQPDGTKKRIGISPGSPNYEAIQNAYQAQLPQQETVYTSQIKTGPGENDWTNVRIDEATGRIMYFEPAIGEEVEYVGKKISKLSPKEFRGPSDVTGVRDPQYLQRIQQQRNEVIKPDMVRLEGLRTGYEGTDNIAQVRSGLIGSMPPGGGQIQWRYKTPDGRTITLEQAVKESRFPEEVLANLAAAESSINTTIGQVAEGASAAQTAKAMTGEERDLQDAERNIKWLEGERDKADKNPDLTPAAKKKLNDEYTKRIKALEDKILDIRTRVGGATSIGGGTTVYEGLPSVTAFSLDPSKQAGQYALIAGGAAIPTGQPISVRSFTPDEIIEKIRTAALAKISLVPTVTDNRFIEIIGGLNNRLSQVQKDIAKAADESDELDPIDFYNQEVTFTHLVRPGTKATTQTKMPLRQAINSFSDAAKEYGSAVNSGNKAAAEAAKKRLADIGLVLSGTWSIPGVGEYDPTPEELGLDSIAGMFETVQPFDFPTSRPIEVTPTQRTAEAPKEATIAPRSSGSTRPPERSVPAYPLMYIPGSKQGRNGYEVASTSFNLLEKLSATPESYIQAGELFSEGQLPKTVDSMLSRTIAFDDGGNGLSSDQKQQVTQVVNDLNKGFADKGEEGKKMRQSAVKALFELTQRSGYPMPYQNASTLVAKAEEIFANAANASDDAVDGMLREWIDLVKGATNGKDVNRANADNNWNLSKGHIGGALTSFANSDAEYQAEIPGNATRFADNVHEAWYELGQLLAAAAKGGTAYQSGTQSVTWMVNPVDESPNAANVHSVFTMPAPRRTFTNKIMDFNVTKNEKGNIARDEDPVFSSLIVRADQVLPTLTPIRERFNKVSGPLRSIAKNQYDRVKGANGDLVAINQTGQRPENNDRTYWDDTSGDMVGRMSHDVLFTGNLFLSNGRNRSVYVKGKGWPKFDSKKIIK